MRDCNGCCIAIVEWKKRKMVQDMAQPPWPEFHWRWLHCYMDWIGCAKDMFHDFSRFSPHLCVGFLFLVGHSHAHSSFRLPPPPPTQLVHTQLAHTQLTHTQLVNTQLTHNLSTHNLSAHNLSAHNLRPGTGQRRHSLHRVAFDLKLSQRRWPSQETSLSHLNWWRSLKVLRFPAAEFFPHMNPGKPGSPRELSRQLSSSPWLVP